MAGHELAAIPVALDPVVLAIHAARSRGAIIASERCGWRGRDLSNTSFVTPGNAMSNAA
jgi:hypothetical protein